MAYKDITAGTYPGRVIQGKFGQSESEKKTPGIGVEIEFDNKTATGEITKERLWWTGWLSAAAIEKTLEQLAFLGYNEESGHEPDGSVSFEKHFMHTEFNVVVEFESYETTVNNQKVTKQAPKIKWINRPGGSAAFATMDTKEVSAMMASVDIKKGMAAARAALGLKNTAAKKTATGSLPNHAPGASNPPPMNTDEQIDQPGSKPPF